MSGSFPLQSSGIVFCRTVKNAVAQGEPPYEGEFNHLNFEQIPSPATTFNIVTRISNFGVDRTYHIFYLIKFPDGQSLETPHFICRPPHPAARELVIFVPSFIFEAQGVYRFELYAGPHKLAVKDLTVAVKSGGTVVTRW
ncbi:MAG: hypothetical protein H0Z39_11520 [Peptococcaceae bacterium]|nr:hypothetical protein [Peptococcaceae bacterium]